MSVRRVSPAEAEGLVARGEVRVLDVRTPAEYDRLGHIPGAVLLPVDLIASAPAVLTAEGPPVLVYCEHGIRSEAAARFLDVAGYERVLDMDGGLSCWDGPREHGPGVIAGPSSWLLENADLVPPSGGALDVACGRGRHALLLAAVGLDVRAVDRDSAAIASLNAVAGRLALPVHGEVLDLETGDVDLGDGLFALVLVTHYLHRPLFPALVRAVAPGGWLLYETFTTAQATRGKPNNPDFLLQPGELPQLVAPLLVRRQREGDFEGRFVASVAAQRH